MAKTISGFDTIEEARAWVRAASSPHDARVALRAVYEDEHAIVAADGYRMRIVEWPGASDTPCLIYPDGMVRPDGEDGIKYPDYAREIPRAETRAATFDLWGDALRTVRYHAAAVIAASMIDSAKDRGARVVRFEARGGVLHVWAAYGRGVPSLETVRTRIAIDVPDMRVALDARLLCDAIAHTNDATVDVWGPRNPIQITTIKDARELIMPMIVEWADDDAK